MNQEQSQQIQAQINSLKIRVFDAEESLKQTQQDFQTVMQKLVEATGQEVENVEQLLEVISERFTPAEETVVEAE